MKSTVAIIDNFDMAQAIPEALDQLSGLADLFVGKKVAIKPNDTWASREDTSACTQGDTLRAVIRYVKGFKPDSITVTGGAGAAQTDQVFTYTGMMDAINDEGAGFFDHNRPPFEKVTLDHGPQKEVMVNPRVFAYDTLISLAQHKAHADADVTLTMKNIAMSYPAADYYGHPRESQQQPNNFFQDLHGFIAGMAKRFRIDLGIIVGHPAMSGTGPIGGHLFESGLTLASRDCVAVDYIGALLLGRDHVRHIEEARQLGLGNALPDRIEIAGFPLERARTLFNRRQDTHQVKVEQLAHR
jgi:uncharacterized protein (DUF362 family)